MGVRYWVSSMSTNSDLGNDRLTLSLQCFVEYHVILDCVKTAIHCIYIVFPGLGWWHLRTVLKTILYDAICICHMLHICFNSLATGKFEWNFRYLIFLIISVIDGCGISCEIALRRTSLDLTDDKSTLVQVMTWCCQATSHHLSQWWPRSLSLWRH